MYNYGLVGNCQAAALISKHGSVEWLCLPRPDSPPVFGGLLDAEGGSFYISSVDADAFCQQSYLPNTNILVTTVCTRESEFRIIDFCPRFQKNRDIYRPPTLFRLVEPVRGRARIKVRCTPVDGWEKRPLKPIVDSGSIKFEVRGELLTLFSNLSSTLIQDEIAFELKEPLYFELSWGIPQRLGNLAEHLRECLSETEQYWKTWVKHCSIPALYQKETIRSALALKLHCYEDTGAILAALTTSLPEEKESGRNWDYRFCWLRDAYFVLSAFHNLGHFEEMEGFLTFLINIAEKHDLARERLSPVYRLDQSLPLPEIEYLNWTGFLKSRPVRSGNQAAEHIQNDVYGEMVMTLAPIFLDERFQHLRTRHHERLIVLLTRFCAQSISQPDAGLWEVRNGWQEHSFSNLMCWAGIERMVHIRELGFAKELDFDLIRAKEQAELALLKAVKEGSLRNGPQDDSFDAALLLLPVLRFPNLELNRETVFKIAEELRVENSNHERHFLYRYLRKDDFGHPQSAFLICSFWLVQALARVGQINEATTVMRAAISAGNEVGLFSEHFIPSKGIQLGNFPQAYSHVGLINAAFSVSPSWHQIL